VRKNAADPRERIISDVAIMAGKPVVRGTRIPVAAVLAHLADNPDIEVLLAAYPRLTVDVVKACLAFAGERVGVSERRPRSGSSAATPGNFS
jgi:uncharacterized protein (DUF433 family)